MDNIQNTSDFLFYQGADGKIKVQIILGDETVWTTQSGMSEIFNVDRSVITKHLQNIFNDGELVEDSVSAKNAHTASDGKTYQTKFYNLDAIISVGYRVSSYEATQFRLWASSVLKEYMIKGFALDDDRLKQGKEIFGKDYFDELLERIKEIRTSERRFYQKITDIYSQCSLDYDPHSPITQEFYATVQNKLHYAVHHNTAAELVNKRVNSSKKNMGLTNWKNAPDGKIIKSDISVAKNYLSSEELSELNDIVNFYLDFAELQAKRQREMKMADWVIKLDDFLKFNEYDVLGDAGKISAKMAKSKAESEYKKFRVIQDENYVSDFDKVVKEAKNTGAIPKEESSSFLMKAIEELKEREKEKEKDPERSVYIPEGKETPSIFGRKKREDKTSEEVKRYSIFDEKLIKALNYDDKGKKEDEK